MKKYGAAIDMMAVIFPFETKFYEAHHIPVRYVGHPLAGRVQASNTRDALMREFDLDPSHPVIGLLPGSRKAEVQRLLPVMLQAAALLRDQNPELQFILPQASTIRDELLQPLLQNAPVNITRVHGRSYDVLACCDAAMVASGTATLETALMGVPMAVLYKVSPLTYFLLKPLIRIPNIALVNIVAERRVVHEFVQKAAQPQSIANEIRRILDNPAYRQTMQHALNEVKTRLGVADGVRSMAELACEMLGKH